MKKNKLTFTEIEKSKCLGTMLVIILTVQDCHLSPVTCLLSPTMYHVFCFCFYKLAELLVESQSSTGPTPVYYAQGLERFGWLFLVLNVFERSRVDSVTCFCLWSKLKTVQDCLSVISVQFSMLRAALEYISDSLLMVLIA